MTLKIAQALQSRTFWTVVLIVVGNALNAKYGFVSANIAAYASTVLGLLAAYFHVNPSQDYTATVTPTVTPVVSVEPTVPLV